jgi:hypothetical protein
MLEPNQAAAFIMAASARATARVNGMLAENSVRWRAGLPIAFGHEDFINVIEQEGISREAIMSIFTHSSMNQVSAVGNPAVEPKVRAAAPNFMLDPSRTESKINTKLDGRGRSNNEIS